MSSISTIYIGLGRGKLVPKASKKAKGKSKKREGA
jgi:hypothetical protein